MVNHVEMGSKGALGNEKRAPRGSSRRTKTDKSVCCVRFNDLKGLVHKFNKTGFRSEKERSLYYDFVKRYEQELRGGGGASAALGMKERLNYPRFSQSICLKPLPQGFQNFANKEKLDALDKLCEDLVIENKSKVVWQYEDVDIQVGHAEKMEVEEGIAADLGPVQEDIVNASCLLDGYALQHVARNQEDKPQGRPPTSSGQYPDVFLQFVSELKWWASRYPDIYPEFEWWEQQSMLLITKLKDRDTYESALGVNSSNTLARSRQQEILSELQEVISGIDPQANYSQASNSSENVECRLENFATSKLHYKQDSAVDPLSPASSVGALPDQGISEALEVAPTCTGRLKKNLEEIHPPVPVQNSAWDVQHPFSKPMMEGIGPQVSHPQAGDLWGNNQCGGECLTPVPHFGGNSASQIVSMDHPISAEPLGLERNTWELWAEKELNQWNEPDLECPLWSTLWSSPPRYIL